MRRRISIAVIGFLPVLLAACSGGDGGGGVIPPPPGEASYHWMNPASQGAELTGLWGPSADNLFATASGGVVLRYDGATWRHTKTPVSAKLNSVWGSDAQHVFAVGQDGVILFFNGTSWSQQTSPTTLPLNDVWGTSATDVYAVGEQRKVIHYDGTSWEPEPGITIGIESLRSMWGSGPSDIYATGLGTTLLHHNGTLWEEVETNATFSLGVVWGTDSLDVFAAGGNGAVAHYDGTWTNINVSESLFPLSVWGTATHDVYAMGFAAGNALSSAYHWDGFSWSPVDMNSVKGVNRVFGVDNRIFAVGQGGLIHEQTGNEFVAMEGGLAADLDAVWVSAAGDEAFAVGDLGTILHFEHGAWAPMNSGTSSRLRGIGATSATNVLAVGENGTALRYTGADWVDVSPGVAVQLNEAWIDGDGAAWVVGDLATVMTYADGIWTPLSLGTITNNLYSVWGSDPGNVYVVGYNSAAYRWIGTQFKPVVVNPPNNYIFNSVTGTGASDVYIGATLISPPSTTHGGGSIFRFDGEIWTPVFSDPISEVLSVWRYGQQGFATGDSGALLRDPDGAPGYAMVFDVDNLPYYVNSVRGSSPRNVFIVGNDGAIVRYSP